MIKAIETDMIMRMVRESAKLIDNSYAYFSPAQVANVVNELLSEFDNGLLSIVFYKDDEAREQKRNVYLEDEPVQANNESIVFCLLKKDGEYLDARISHGDKTVELPNKSLKAAQTVY